MKVNYLATPGTTPVLATQLTIRTRVVAEATSFGLIARRTRAAKGTGNLAPDSVGLILLIIHTNSRRFTRIETDVNTVNKVAQRVPTVVQVANE
jgi:hypothetical protein